jgi:tRNA(Ile2) C34 agmatinyltransferase TiaS
MDVCGICGGELVLMGQLGRKAHFRCRACGMEWSKDIEEEEDDDSGED